MTNEELKSYVVKITSDEEGEEILGTGFLVSNEGDVLTCAHVVNKNPVLTDFHPYDTLWINRQRVTVRESHPEKDVALLKWNSAPKIHVMKLSPSFIPSGTDAFVLFGYGEREHLFPDGATIRGEIIGQDRYNDQEVERRGPMLKLAYLSQSITGGFSGSPVWCQRTQSVVGMMTIDVREGKLGEFGLAIPAKTIVDAFPETLRPKDPLGNVFPDTRGFVGREEELDKLAAAVNDPLAKVIIIDGLAGIGKSMLMSRFVTDNTRCPYEPDQVLLIECNKDMPLLTISRCLSLIFKLHGNEVLAKKMEADFVDSGEVIAGFGKWLLIFENFEELLHYDRAWDEDDNFEDEVLNIEDERVSRFFERLLSGSHAAKVLILSRATPELRGNQSFLCRVFARKLAGLSTAQLRKYAQQFTDYTFTMPDWERVDEYIAGHPKAFEFLCQLLKEPGNTVEKVLPPIEVGRRTRLRKRVKNELLKQLYERLTEGECRVMETVCVLRKPFSEDMAQELLAGTGHGTDMLDEQIETLERRSLLDRTDKADEWMPHAIVRDFFYHINQQKNERLHKAAAEYYDQPFLEGIVQLSDTDNIVEAIYHYEQTSEVQEYERLMTLLASALDRLGREGYAQGLWEEAERTLKRRLHYEPENWRVHFHYANVLRKQKKFSDETTQAYENALRLNPGDARHQAITLQAYGVSLKEQGDYAGAVAKFEASLACDPDARSRAITLQAYGVSLKEQGDYAGAVAKFEASLACDPDARSRAITLQAYGVSLKEQGDYAGAVAKFEASLACDPDARHQAITLQAYGVSLKEQGDYAGAVAKFEASLACDPDARQKAITLQAYGVSLKEQGDYAGAVAKFEASLACNPDARSRAITLQAYGVSLKEQGDYAGAVAKFEASLACDPDARSRAITLQAYGVSLKEQGDYAGAVAKFEASLACDPDARQKAITLQAYGVSLKEQGDYAGAVAKFEASLACDPDARQKAITLQAYGVSLKEQGDYAGAVAKFEASLACDPDARQKAITLQAYGVSLKEQGDYAGAVAKFEAALKLAHQRRQRARICNQLGQILDRLPERRQEAEAYFTQALKLDDRNSYTYCWYLALLLRDGRTGEAQALYNRASRRCSPRDLTFVKRAYERERRKCSRPLTQKPVKKNFSSRLVRLQGLIRQQHFEAADRLVRTLLHDAPESSEIHNQQGNLFKEQQLWEKAEQAYRMALRYANTKKQRAKYLNNLALLVLAMEATERYQEAVELCQEAETVCPEFPWAAKTRELLLQKMAEHE